MSHNGGSISPHLGAEIVGRISLVALQVSLGYLHPYFRLLGVGVSLLSMVMVVVSWHGWGICKDAKKGTRRTDGTGRKTRLFDVKPLQRKSDFNDQPGGWISTRRKKKERILQSHKIPDQCASRTRRQHIFISRAKSFVHLGVLRPPKEAGCNLSDPVSLIIPGYSYLTIQKPGRKIITRHENN